MLTGKITELITERGFGFIREKGSGPNIFFHSGSLASVLFDQLRVGQKVQFEMESNERRPRMRAVNVQPIA
jgi:cold shock protein